MQLFGKSLLTMLVATALLTTAAHAQDAATEVTPIHPVHEGNSVSIPADKITFGPTGVKTKIGEIFAGPAFGDLSKGKHSTFIRMPAGFVSPVHTHTDDYYAVVIKGEAVNGRPGDKDIRLPVGSYWFQRGEEAHITKCVSKTDCLFFLTQPGKFDYVPMQQ